MPRTCRICIAALFSLCVASCGGDRVILEPDCRVFPDQDSSPYILPYLIGESHRALPHAARDPVDNPQYYAVDILMPIGTPIVATRAGTVVRIEESFVDGDNQPGHENFMLVEHEDGSFSRYYHLTKDGAIFEVGESVAQLDIIASSGHTGNSSEPHVHFDVVDSNCDIRSSVFNMLNTCQSVPVTFLNTQPPNPCGLEFRVTYTALSF